MPQGILADKSYAKLSYLALLSCKGLAVIMYKLCSEDLLERMAHVRIYGRKKPRLILCIFLFTKNWRLLLVFRFFTSRLIPCCWLHYAIPGSAIFLWIPELPNKIFTCCHLEHGKHNITKNVSLAAQYIFCLSYAVVIGKSSFC